MEALDPLFQAWAGERENDERFGDFVVRTGVVRAVKNGQDFHSQEL